jgi:molybdopterin synthase catalytic subunit
VAALREGPLDPQSLVAACVRPECGAVVLFLGTTRDHHQGRAVVELAYECYPRMALPALARLEREACARFAVADCRVEHRLGVVPVREASVAVAVAAVHRAAAFDAARWVMDELKRSVPVWKHERYADGGGAWVEGTPLS